MNRGEVWWYDHPRGRRPYLVLTRQAGVAHLRQLIGVPTTSSHRGIPTEVHLDEDDGMPRACCLSLDNVTQILPVLCTERITTLSPARMREVCVALSAATGC